jgi:hypothetical protein
MTAFLVIVTLVGGEIDWRPMDSMHHCMMVAATMNVRTNPLHLSGRPTAYCAWGDEVPDWDDKVPEGDKSDRPRFGSFRSFR